MWWFALTIIILLNDDFVSAKYVFSSSKVTWKDAQNICNVPSVGDIVYTKSDFTGLPETFTAWTSSRNLTSDWTSFYGCLDVSDDIVAINDIKQTLNQYFPNSEHAVELKSVFKCAHFCNTKSEVFTFLKHVCKCIYENELKSQLVKMQVCIYWDPTKKENVDDVYSVSRRSLPIFQYKTDLQTKITKKGDEKPNRHHCLAKTNGIFTTNDCTSKKMFKCEGGHTGYGTWTNATYTCLLKDKSLLKNQSTYSDYWLRYFKYEEGKGKEHCVAIQKNGTSLPLTYKFRPCYEQWPVLCQDENDPSHTNTAISMNHGNLFSTESTFTSSNLSDAQRPGVKNDTFGKIVVVNVLLFGLCILFVSLIKLRKNLNMQLCQTVNKKFRREEINGNPTVQSDDNIERNGGISR